MKKILIVSSDKQLLDLLKYVLSYKNFNVLTEHNPAETFNDIQRFSPDLLIVDLILNDHNGGAISHQIKSDPRWRDMQVVILSDYELETHYPSKFGCNLVIQKSGDISPLIQSIINLFEETEFSHR